VLQYSTATTALALTLDQALTLGGIRTTNTGVFTIAAGAGTLTLDGTGLTAANQSFADAGVAYLANTSTVAGGLTVNSAISFGNTALDIGTTSSGTTLIGGVITATANQSLNFRANGTGAITDSAAIGTTGSTIAISNLGTSTGLTTLSGALGVSVSSVTQNSATSALTLSGANGSFTGPVNLSAGTLNIGSATALGSGTLTISAGTTINSSGGAQTLTTNNLQQWNGNFTFTGTSNLTFGTGAITLGTNVAVTVNGQSLFENGAIGDSGSGFGLTKLGTLNLFLQGASTYTGATTIGTAGSTASGGNLGVQGVSGSINTSSGYTINGSGSRLLLDNTAGNVDRVNHSATVTLNLGGELSLTGNATANTTQTIGSLALGTGSGIVTVTSPTGAVTTLAASSLSRTNNSTGLVRGTSLNQSAATTVSRITLGTAPTGTNFVGTNTLNNGTTTDATQALAIVPWLIGDTSATGSGSNFVTYDSTLGLRVLTAAEDTTLTAASTTAANPVNAVAFNGTVTASGLTVNSLLFSTATQTLNGSGALTVNSGAVATVANTEAIGSGFSSLTLGNGEGVVTATAGNTLTVNTPVNVTGGGGLTTSGAGTVVLAASNLYTGQTTVNQGTLQIGTGTAGDLGTNTANIVLNGGNLTFGRTNAGLTLANNISGIGTVTENGVGGTTVLSGSNTYSGATTVTNGTLQLLALPANTTGGVSASLSANSALTLAAGTTLQLRGDSSATFNSGVITLPAAGASTAVTFDVNTNGAATTGNVYTLGGTLPAVNVNSGSAGTLSLTLNVIGGNGSILSLPSTQLTTSGNGGNFFINPTTGNLIIAGLTGSTGNGTATTLEGSGSTTFTGSVQQGAARGLTLNLSQTGSVIFNGVDTNGTTFLLNNGTTVVNNNSGLNGTPTLGTITSTANNVNLLLGGTNATGTVAGTNGGIAVANAIKVEDPDTGLLTIGGQNTSGTNTYSGIVTLGATANTGVSANLVAATGGEVDFTNTIVKNGTATTGAITVNSPYTINNGTTTVTPTGIVKLTAVNTYVGGTTVSGGTLLVDNTSGSGVGSGAVAVNSGGTLGGTGLLTVSSVTVNSGGTLAPGATLGATTGTLTLASTAATTINGTLAIALGSTGANGTFLTNNGNLTVGGATLTLAGLTPVAGTIYDLVNYTGTLAASGSNEGFATINGPAGFTYSVVAGTTFTSSDLELDVMPVPEPSTWAAVLTGLCLLGFSLRRKRDQAA
jgi:fibronectin-binding autotransporter adhesin